MVILKNPKIKLYYVANFCNYPGNQSHTLRKTYFRGAFSASVAAW